MRNPGSGKTVSYCTFLGRMALLGKDEAIKIARSEHACRVRCAIRWKDKRDADMVYDRGRLA